MGSEGFQNSSPAHAVELSPFFVDATEVTNAQYLEFCEATGHRVPEFWSMLRAEAGAYYFDEHELDDLGHRLLEAGRALHAVEVMRVTVQLRPTSYEARRSLGEALRALGNRCEAVRAFEQTLELNPYSGATRAMLAELWGEP